MLAPSMMAPGAGVGGWAAKLERREVDTRSMHQQGQCMMSERCWEQGDEEGLCTPS